MASVPVDIEGPRPDFDQFDAECLRDWGFTLKETYKLTLRFYKGELFSMSPSPQGFYLLVGQAL